MLCNSSLVAGAVLMSFLADAQIWSPPTALSPDSMPVVEVRLAPPEHALPQISAEVGILEKARESAETVMRQELASALVAAIKKTKAEIDSMVERTMSVLQLRRVGWRSASFLHAQKGSTFRGAVGEQAYAIKLTVSAMEPPGSQLQSTMESIESKRSNAEKQTFEQAQAELQGLTKIVLHELGAQIHSQVSALQRSEAAQKAAWLDTSQKLEDMGPVGLASQANVRVASAENAFPTVTDLTQDMEYRRDNVESQDRADIIAIELKLLEAANEMITDAVSSAVSRMMR